MLSNTLEDSFISTNFFNSSLPYVQTERVEDTENDVSSTTTPWTIFGPGLSSRNRNESDFDDLNSPGPLLIIWSYKEIVEKGHTM